MKKLHIKWKDALLTVGVLSFFMILSLVLEAMLSVEKLIPAIFTLAVFLVSLYTEGYIYGIAAAFISMLAVNFAFTFPYFKFNFTIFENFVSAVVMLVVTFLTGMLTTKLKQQEKLKVETEKEKMRANLLRAVSHDLRTPLTTIYGSSSAMIENFDELSDAQKLELAEGIREDAQWMVGMVENLLSVTRMENKGVKLHKTPVVLEELIDSVLTRFRKRYPKQQVEVNIPDDFISIPMDAVLITQVIVNMLENAVQHATGMTKLTLNVFVQENNAVFEIIDDGCGIPKNRIDEIFTGYYEKKEVPVDNQKRSTGIGLSVCASVIKAHEGEISVKNLKTGGCCFRFLLKMEDDSDEQ